MKMFFVVLLSTPDKLKNMPDHGAGGNQTYDLRNVLSTELRGQVRSNM